MEINLAKAKKWDENKTYRVAAVQIWNSLLTETNRLISHAAVFQASLEKFLLYNNISAYSTLVDFVVALVT